MNNLLHANFMRLKKNRVLFLCCLGLLAFGILIPVKNYLDFSPSGEIPSLDNFFFNHLLCMGILSAVFCSLFIGTEYSDGTLRNKLVAGRIRSAIYLANFITCTIAILFMSLVSFAGMAVIGIPLLGFLEAGLSQILLYFINWFFLMLALASIYNLISMLNQNKAVTAVLCLLLAFLALILATYLNSRLTAPEFYSDYVFTDSLGGFIESPIVNPLYLRGFSRTLYQFLLDFLPSGKALQLCSMSAGHLWQMSLYSLIIIVGCNMAGCLIFRKKDIK